MARILLVDDNHIVREYLPALLTSRGYEVDVAESAEVAIEILPNGYDLVLTDNYMGTGMTGVELCERISNNEVVVVFSSEHSLKRDAINAGAKAFIPKPAQINDIAKTIDEVLDEN